MVFYVETSPEVKAEVKLLNEYTLLSASEIAKKCNISRASVYRIVTGTKRFKRKKSTGRRRKLSKKDERQIKRTLLKLRHTDGTVSCSRILAESGIDSSRISIWTGRRTLNRLGYRFLVSRKKGLLTSKDLVKRLKFAKAMKKTKPKAFWTDDVCFYLDGVSFVHKYNPYSDSIAPVSRIWRKPSEGLAPGCTSKGSHVGSGGRTVKFFVAISYGEGVIFCHQYEHLNGEYFKNIILEHFDGIFRLSNRSHSRIFIQDGDPSQNSAAARSAFKAIGAKLFSIPPRSPDLNPIENLFHLVKRNLKKQATEKKITYESVEQYAQRIENTFKALDKTLINKIISSMPARINDTIKNNGGRTRF